MPRCHRILAVLAVWLLFGAAAVCQTLPAEVDATGFFGPKIMGRIKAACPAKAPGDKHNPIIVVLPEGLGTLHAFLHKNSPILVVEGSLPVDLGAAVLLPSDAFVLKRYLFIYSRTGGVLAHDDFPAELRNPLKAFWPQGKLELFDKGSAARAEPAGDVLDEIRRVLDLDQVHGRSVVEFKLAPGKAGAKAISSTGLLVFGDVVHPFGIDLNLNNPEILFEKAGLLRTITLAGVATIRNRTYDFYAKGSKATAPDIFRLRTAELRPQDLVELVKAFSQPVFYLAPGLDPGWKLELIPSFTLLPLNNQPQVQIFAARPGASDMAAGITGPAILIAARLRVDSFHQDLVQADVKLSQSPGSQTRLDAAFNLPRFSLPGTDMTFLAASTTIKAATGSLPSWTVRAESDHPCFKKKFSFAVDGRGSIHLDLHAAELAECLEPAKFMANFKACAGETLKTATWALKTGAQVFHLAEEGMLNEGGKVFSEDTLVTAAKAAAYPAEKVVAWAHAGRKTAEQVGNLLGKVYDKDALLTAVDKTYGSDQVAAFGKAAGYGAEDMVHWADAASKTPAQVASMLGKAFSKEELLNAGIKAFGRHQVAAIAKAAGYTAKEVYAWTYLIRKNADEAFAILAKAYPKDDVLAYGKHTYRMGNEAVAEAGRGIGYSARAVSDWFHAGGVSHREAARVLHAAGYTKDQVKGALEDAYHLSGHEAEETWKEASGAVKQVGHWIQNVF